MRNVSKSLLMTAVICGSLGMMASAYAAEDFQSFNLDQIVVTANRMEQSNFDAHANVNVVTRQDIEKNHYSTVSEALRRVPGVTIQNYSASGANYTANKLNINGTSYVLVLVDGQRANTNGSVFSVFQSSELSNMDNIERIEVLKGSASTLYGSDAVGGVINIITRKPAGGEESTQATVTGGSYGKRMFSLYHQGAAENGIYWTAGAQKDRMSEYKDGDGNKVVNSVDSSTVDLKLGHRTDKSDLSVGYDRYRSDYTRPDKDGMDKKALSGRKDNEKYSVRFNYDFDEHLSNKMNYFSRTSDLDDNLAEPAKTWTMREKTWGFSDELTFRKGQHAVIAGVDYYKDAMNKYHDQYTPSLTGDVSNTGYYLQDTMTFGRVTVTPGVRFSHHSIYGNNTSASGVVAYDVTDKVSTYVSYKEFFRAPYLYELYNPTYGSEKLDPEKGHTWEWGANAFLDDKTTVSTHIFRTKSDNLIGFNSDTWKYYNAGEETINGWDVQLTRQLDRHFRANASYAHLSIPASKNRSGSIPTGTWNLGLDYDNAKFNGNITAQGIMNRPGTPAKQSQVSDSNKSFWVFNAAMNYKPEKDVTVFVTANNIFNRMYTDMTYDMTHPGGPGWYSQPGRNFQVGMEYKF
mgnify:CR=1 FL=1